MSQEEIITKIKEAVESDPNKDYIQSISLFGSYLRGDAKEDSDVDLTTKDGLSRYIRKDVVKEAKKIYQNE